MATIKRSALLPYSAEQVYELINDIAAYPQYMVGCSGAEVIAHEDDFMEARLDLSMAGFQYSFTTRNRLQAPVSVVMELVDGPFKSFKGEWTITVLGEQACKVNLVLEFTLASRVLGVAARAMFNPMANNLVEALVARARSQYPSV